MHKLALRDLKRWWQLLMVHFGCGINSPEIQIILTEMLTEHVSWISYLNFRAIGRVCGLFLRPSFNSPRG
jgi:hypothetical protein